MNKVLYNKESSVIIAIANDITLAQNAPDNYICDFGDYKTVYCSEDAEIGNTDHEIGFFGDKLLYVDGEVTNNPNYIERLTPEQELAQLKEKYEMLSSAFDEFLLMMM